MASSSAFGPKRGSVQADSLFASIRNTDGVVLKASLALGCRLVRRALVNAGPRRPKDRPLLPWPPLTLTVRKISEISRLLASMKTSSGASRKQRTQRPVSSH